MYTPMKWAGRLEKEGAKMIREGLQAEQIANKIGADVLDVLRWAKQHRLGKHLEENEGCVTRKATPEELASFRRKLPAEAQPPPEANKETSPQKVKAVRRRRTATTSKDAIELKKEEAYRIVMADVAEEAERFHMLEIFLRKQLVKMTEKRENDG